MNVDTFLTGLWGKEPPGRVQLWRLRDKRAVYPLSLTAAQAVAGGQTDVYTCVALTSEARATNRRGRPEAKDARAIAGMWLDLDVNGGPDSKTNAAASVDDAIAVANLLLTPTVLINSGYGVHAWYLFDEPWLFASQAEQGAAAVMSAQFQQLHRQQCAWPIDATHDLARLMRLPGTFNGKAGGKAPVDVIRVPGVRYARGEIADLALTAGPVSLTSASSGRTDLQVKVQPGCSIDQGALDALLEDPEIYMTFMHLVPTAGWKDDSLSSHDMSLATQLVNAGCPDQLVADVLVAHRAHHGDKGNKGSRADYLELTISRAKTPMRKQAA